MHAVVRGDIHTNDGWGSEPYRARKRPAPAPGGHSTALRRGYIAHYRLNQDGSLDLVSYSYPVSGPPGHDPVGETFEGDFWLVMRETAFGPRTYIPFRDGKVVVDRVAWVFEDSPFPSSFSPWALG